MDGNRKKELELREQNKTITKLEEKELDLLRRLQEVIDEQNAEAARLQDEKLETAAVEGDLQARKTLEDREIAKKEQEIRDQVNKDLDKKLDRKQPEDGDTVAEQQEIQAQKDEKKKEAREKEKVEIAK